MSDTGLAVFSFWKKNGLILYSSNEIGSVDYGHVKAHFRGNLEHFPNHII